ncbi:MAG: carbohydrate ABC transporter permease [Caldilineaceae bacterium]
MTTAKQVASAGNKPSQWSWEVAAIYLFLLIFSFFILLPFIWPFLSAFTNKPANVSSLYLYWPESFTWDHFYDAIIGRGQALTLMRNSLVVSLSSVVLGLIVCAFGGYALSRGSFRYKRALMFAILLIQIIPGTATVLPFYLIIRNLHLINTLAGVIIGITVGTIPFMLWVMKGFFDTVPLELEEAAWLDGASRWQTLSRIVFPLALPGVGAAAILSFNGAWGAFFLPLIMLSDGEKFVMPLGLFRALIAYTNLDYGMLNAMALLYMLPSLLIFVFARQYLIKGTMAGAMAGQ